MCYKCSGDESIESVKVGRCKDNICICLIVVKVKFFCKV